MKTRNPEDGDWWYTNGYKFLENWIQWRQENTHMSIAKLDDGSLAIELELAPVVNGVTVKMAVDRVFYDSYNKEYVIVDLKTGKTTPQSSLQLGFYAYGIRNPELVQVILRTVLDEHGEPGAEWFPGDVVEFPAPNGGTYAGVLKNIDATRAVFDFNHPLAGQRLRLQARVIGVL
jgi:FKBP-type peptidyl-prolyl cis-trans isomerase SlpA